MYSPVWWIKLNYFVNDFISESIHTNDFCKSSKIDPTLSYLIRFSVINSVTHKRWRWWLWWWWKPNWSSLIILLVYRKSLNFLEDMFKNFSSGWKKAYWSIIHQICRIRVGFMSWNENGMLKCFQKVILIIWIT